MAEIVVVGSVNIDLVATAPRLPAAGETLIGRSFMTVPGGKGANQAYGAGKLGGKAAMVGAIGADAFGEASAANLVSAGVDVGPLRWIPGTPTGVAVIIVDETAQNSIVVIPGANAALTPDDLDAAASIFAGVKVLLVQLEIPLLVVLRAMRLAKERGASVILDPAPVCPLPGSLLALVDFLTPNQIEAEMLTGVHVVDRATACEAAGVLRRQGVGRVLVKLGAGGVVLLGDDGMDYVPGHRVEAVDTTAAGDAFSAGLGVALAREAPVGEAVRYANAVAALSVTRRGAQSSMPTADEVSAFLAGGDVGKEV